jgi:hypothetical protein
MLKGLSLIVANETTLAVRRRVRSAAYYAAAGFIALTGLGVGLIALHSWMSSFMPVIQSLLIIMGGLVAVASCLGVAGYVISRRKSQTPIGKAAALALAPTALRLAANRGVLSSISMGGIIALAAVLGRRIARD